jgi:nitrite reductase/ring-hydroxylating ferredoxin subunit
MRKLLYILSFIAVCVSCKKDNNNNVPETPVDISIYTNNPSFVNISVVGGWTYITGGIRGIIVYRKSNTEFMAYDRNCTYQPSDPCATVVMDVSNIEAKDTCCNSRFSIYDGSVFQGPAAAPLKAYSTTFNGSVLHIYN